MKSAVFSAAVVARHAARGSRPSCGAMVLVRSRIHAIPIRAGLVRHLHQRWTVKFSIHGRRMNYAVKALSLVERTLNRSFVTHHRISVNQGRRGHPSASAPVEPLRLVTRRPTAPTQTSVPLVIRRPTPRNSGPPSSSPEVRPTSRTRESVPAQSGVPVTALPAGELDRVTDHVIRNLDRRLSSWRERRGKG